MSQLLKVMLLSVIALFSNLIIAGGGDPPTPEEQFENFVNPTLPVQSTFNKKLLKSILSESEWYKKNASYQDKEWEKFESFKEAINNTLIEAERPKLFGMKSKHSREGCLSSVSFPWSMYALMVQDGVGRDERIINKVTENQKENARLEWFKYYVKTAKNCLSSSNDVEPSDAFISHFGNSLVYDYLTRYKKFKNNPSAETAEGVIDDKILNMLNEYGVKNLDYLKLVEVAKSIIGMEKNDLIDWTGEFPFDSRGSWGSTCLGEKSKGAVLRLVDILAKNKGVSDQELRAMIVARVEVAALCDQGKKELVIFEEIENFPTEWVAYFQGLQYFYMKNYESARDAYTKSYNGTGLIKSLSSYMAAKSNLYSAQSKWISWKGKTTLNSSSLDEALKWFEKHIDDNGMYKESAFGMLGRIYYLQEKTEQYEKNLKERLWTSLNVGNYESTSSIVEEYLARSNAITFLSHFKSYIDLNGISTLNSSFKNMANFIAGFEAYQEGQYEKSINYLKGLSYSAGFNVMLEAARELGDGSTEENIINKFLKGNTKELYLAELNYRKNGFSAFLSSNNEKLIYEASSAICTSKELEGIIRKNATIPGMKYSQQVMYKSLLLDYNFTGLNELFNDPIFKLGEYSLIRTAVKQVVGEDSLGKAYMNIGYFLSIKESREGEGALHRFLSARHPEKFCDDHLAGGRNGPEHFYKKSLDFFNKDEINTDEAKTLSFMVNCGRPGRKGCWGYRPYEMESTKEIFERLHSKYKGSKWAEKAPHYYH